MEPYPIVKRSDVDPVVFEEIKKKILSADACGMDFEFIETDDDLDTLLQRFRVKGEIGPSILTIIDASSVEKSAVMIVETSWYDADEDKCIYPSAADSRKFLSDADQGEPLRTIATNLTISNKMYEKLLEPARSHMARCS